MSISLSNALSVSSYDLPKSLSGNVKAASGKTPEAEFLEFAKKTPAEHIRDAMLKKLGLSQEEFDNMDSASQKAVTEQITAEIKKQIEASGDKRTGQITDIKV
jgi:TPP-dependent pyruvate/acetoin dehydrogenase alpha subunit